MHRKSPDAVIIFFVVSPDHRIRLDLRTFEVDSGHDIVSARYTDDQSVIVFLLQGILKIAEVDDSCWGVSA